MLHQLILFHVTHLAHFAVGLRPPVVPCIRIHTLCPNSSYSASSYYNPFKLILIPPSHSHPPYNF
ncbi:hypothetical protein E2C01_011068 [Portunus trituberculatus]|uniref:Uncharacterized protein n=1 Tax=Portunus trituberculatus TaxID=210409 RepID=A0A5B7DAA3_PORTR|nr:hypothetical protein [Portunus trituberculatus]